MVAHASQIPDTSFFLTLPPDLFAMAFGTEWFIKVGEDPPAVEEANRPSVMETSLFGGTDADAKER
jgi:hypothetical protein